MRYLINQKKLVESLAKDTLSNRRLNVYFICYSFIFIVCSVFGTSEYNNNNIIMTFFEFIICTFGLIVSYLINGDKKFIQRYIAIDLSITCIFIIPFIFITILLAFFGIVEKNLQQILIIVNTIFSGLTIFNFYKIKKIEKLFN